MFDHVTLRVADLPAAKRAYGRLLDAIEVVLTAASHSVAVWGHFAIAATKEERPATSNAHIAFSVASREHVSAFWNAGLEAGFADGGQPGPRPQIAEGYYAAYLVDKAGNRIEGANRS